MDVLSVLWNRAIMADDASAVRGKGWLIALPGQVALFGLAVSLLDRAALGSVLESGMAQPNSASLYFLTATALFIPATVLFRRGSPRAATAGLLLIGLLTPPYLTLLIFQSLSDPPWDLLGDALPPTMDWYAAARAALLGAAAMAYLISLYLLVRSTAAGWRATPVPRTTPLMLLHLPLTGVHVTVLTFVAIGQASRIAQEEVRAAARGKLFSGAHLFYLENAAELAWTYAVLFTVAGTIALALAVIAWRAGDHPALAAALGVAGLPFLLLLLVVSAGTPFMLSGAADEAVPPILGSGPDWYFPAILTQTALGAVAYVASVVALIKGVRPRRAGLAPAAVLLDRQR
jgi:hypothetical protein